MKNLRTLLLMMTFVLASGFMSAQKTAHIEVEDNPRGIIFSPDGKKLYGVSSGGEMLTLERDAAVESTDQLATKARKEVWQTVLTPGKIWEGTIRSLKHKQTAEVKMIVRGFELEGKQVTLELVPKVQQKAKVVFEGNILVSPNSLLIFFSINSNSSSNLTCNHLYYR